MNMMTVTKNIDNNTWYFLDDEKTSAKKTEKISWKKIVFKTQFLKPSVILYESTLGDDLETGDIIVDDNNYINYCYGWRYYPVIKIFNKFYLVYNHFGHIIPNASYKKICTGFDDLYYYLRIYGVKN